MSSNAFARSRPRVRHQRVPKTHCDHPRFLQLVNELARINDLKKKQEEAECGSGNAEASCNSEDDANSANSNTGGGSGGSVASSAGACSASAQHSVAGSSCCNQIAQTSNAYRGQDNNNQSTSTLSDNSSGHPQTAPPPQTQQPIGNVNSTNSSSNNNNNDVINNSGSNHNSSNATNQLQDHHHHHHHHNHNHHPYRHQSSNISYQQQPNQSQTTGNNLQHHDRCPSKSSSTSFGYSKQNLVVDQNNISHFSSNNNSDLRQDENRSKRKRSANDSLAHSKKNSSCGGNSKRYKTSSDAIRPLSPSFTKCPICLLDSMDRDPSFTNTCFHLFCYVCIENWTKNKATCPLCRTKFTKIIYKIKSATNFEEKPANPIRRDDDDGYNLNDRLMLEQISGINSNSMVSSRNSVVHNDEVQFLFENINRNPEVLMPQYFVNTLDFRPSDSINSFNTVTTTANFNPNVPHPPFPTTSYQINPANYILYPAPPNRISPTTSTAPTSAYNEPIGHGVTNITRRLSRSGRYVYPTRTFESPNVLTPPRASRSSTVISQQISFERQLHLHPHQHPHSHQHQHPHQHLHHTNTHQLHHQHQSHYPHQHRSTLEISPRHHSDQSPHLPPTLPYQIPTRQYNQNPYTRRPYNNHPVEHHSQNLLDSLYRQSMPDNM